MRMRANFLDVFRGTGFRQEVMRHLLKYFAVYQEIGIDEHVQSMVHHSFSRIFDRDHPEIRAPPFDLTEHFLDAIDGHILRR